MRITRSFRLLVRVLGQVSYSRPEAESLMPKRGRGEVTVGQATPTLLVRFALPSAASTYPKRMSEQERANNGLQSAKHREVL